MVQTCNLSADDVCRHLLKDCCHQPVPTAGIYSNAIRFSRDNTMLNISVMIDIGHALFCYCSKFHRCQLL